MNDVSQPKTSDREVALELMASERERQRAFRKAKRHTLLVKSLRVMLPVVALGSIGVLGVSFYAKSGLKAANVAVGTVRIDPTNLTMEDPRYDGFGKDGTAYRVHAKSAVADFKMSKPIRLNAIDGELIQPSGVVTRLAAKWGTYDQKKEILELHDEIDIAGTDGTKARLTRATVWTKENRIVSNEPVWAQMKAGTIQARAMEINGKARTASFKDGVELNLNPQAGREGGAVGAQSAARQPSSLPGLQANSGAPVIVTARTLDVDDTRHTALFRSEVVAKQGEATLQAPELDVLYEGRASLPGQADEAKQTEAPGQARLQKILARGGVVMTSRDSRADAETLDYDAVKEQALLRGGVVMTQPPDRRVTATTALLDQKADRADLDGDVVVTQGKNVMRAERLSIDRRSGVARLASPADGSRRAGRISTLLHQRAEPGAAARKPKTRSANAGNGLLGDGFRTNPDEPILIEATTLDIHDRRHRAIYQGQVVAKQGAFVVRTEQLTAHYTGSSGLAADAERGKESEGGAPNLTRIEARQGVVVTGSDGQQAKGEWADFDVKANTIVLGGQVEVTQSVKGAGPDKQQAMRLPSGMRFVIDLGTGEYRTEVEPGKPVALPGPKVSGAFATTVVPPRKPGTGSVPFCPEGAICRANRPQLLIYPNQFEKGKSGSASKQSDRNQRRDERNPSSGASPPAAGASSWSATTSPAGAR